MPRTLLPTSVAVAVFDLSPSRAFVGPEIAPGLHLAYVGEVARASPPMLSVLVDLSQFKRQETTQHGRYAAVLPDRPRAILLPRKKACHPVNVGLM